MGLARLLALFVPLAAALQTGDRAEERLVPWIREHGGVLSDSVAISSAYGGRGFVAVTAIKKGDPIFDIPPIVHLNPADQVKAHRLPRMISAHMGRTVAWAAHVAREVERCKAERALGGSRSGFHDLFWDAVEGHIALMDDDPVFWKPHEQEALGVEYAGRLRKERAVSDENYEQIVKFFREVCPKQVENPAECGEILGNFSRDEFAWAANLPKSRTFADEDMGRYVPYVSLVNHRPAGVSNAEFELGDTLRVWASRDISEGEEVSITYAHESNDHLLMQYGFTQAPSVEPSYYFYIPDGAPDGHPEALGSAVELTTPSFISYDSGSLINDESELEESELYPWEGPSKELAALFHESAESLGRAVAFYEDRFSRDPALVSFIDQLRRNRKRNARSRVWWAEEESANAIDASTAEALGSRRASDAARVKMCNYMCLLLYSEALSVHREDSTEHAAAPASPEVMAILAKLRAGHHDYNYQYYDQEL